MNVLAIGSGVSVLWWVKFRLSSLTRDIVANRLPTTRAIRTALRVLGLIDVLYECFYDAACRKVCVDASNGTTGC